MPRTPRPRWPEYRRLEPATFARTRDGVEIACYDFGGEGPPLLLVHATGFCAAVMSALATALRVSFHCYAVDLRAHGASELPAHGDLHWRGFAADTLSAVDELGLDSPVGFGHSCGGAALLLAEQARPGTFGSLHCYEPIVFPSDDPLEPDVDRNPLAAGALRRRRTFGSREEALANFSAKAPFDRLRADVLATYVDNGFDTDDDGHLRLRCRREDEAAVFAHSFSHDAYSRMDLVRCCVDLVCGALTDGIGVGHLGLLAGRLGCSRVVSMDGLGHLGPLEDPDAVAAQVAAGLRPSDSPTN